MEEASTRPKLAGLILVFMLLVGCTPTREALVHSPGPSAPAEPIVQEPAQKQFVRVAPEGPSLRLHLRDLAVILELLDQLDHTRPEWRQDFLAELAEADEEGVLEIVASWQSVVRALPPVPPESVVAVTSRPVAARVVPGETTEEPITPTADETASAATGVERGDAFSTVTEEKSITPTQDDAPITESPTPEEWGDLAAEQPDSESLETVPDARSTEQPRLQSLTDSEVLDLLIARLEQPGGSAEKLRVAGLLRELGETTGKIDVKLWDELVPLFRAALKTKPTDQQSLNSSLDALHARFCPPKPLKITRPTFCSRIDGFGKFEPLGKSELESGGWVLLYAELANFQNQKVGQSYETRLESDVELVTSGGERVFGQVFGLVPDVCQSPRNDHFMAWRFRLPAALPGGDYLLRIRVRDSFSDAEARVELRVPVIQTK